MFYYHRIEDNVLYLYLNLEEFAKLGSIPENLTVKEKILKYIYESNIHSHIEKIKVVCSGVVIATFLLPNMAFNIPSEPETNIVNINNEITEVSKIKDDILSEEIDLDNIEIEEPKTESNDKAVSKETANKTTTPTTPKAETPSVQSKEETKDKEEFKIKVKRVNGQIIDIYLEEYIVGVVGGEMPASFDKEALKAQSVAARTYALLRMQTQGIVTDTVATQVYKDENQLRAVWGSEFNFYYSKIKNAVSETKGIVMKYNGQYIDAVYHSTNNGKTESAFNVWGNNIPYLVSVDSRWDKNATSYLRNSNFETSLILNALGINVSDLEEISILSRTESNYINQISFGDTIFTGKKVRELLGLRSSDFIINVNDSVTSITTYGYGHAVGMSQYGANGMAKEGYKYDQILKHYYTGVSLDKLNNN